MIISGVRAFTEVIKVINEVIIVGLDPIGLVPLWAETPELSLFLSPLPCEDTVRRWPTASQKKGLHQKNINMLPPQWRTPILHNYEKINLCCLGHPVYGTLLWQPELTKIGMSAPSSDAYYNNQRGHHSFNQHHEMSIMHKTVKSAGHIKTNGTWILCPRKWLSQRC